MSEYLIIYDNKHKNIIEEPCYNFPYELDLFQNEACYRISKNENVFVTAHTGCGKTVVAIYGIAHCLKNNKKVIYTSPTKSLSNQKFKEFSEKFPDVGILTGDIKMNPEAQCVIMTTEILLNILYKENNHQSISIDDIGCVIFDEVHYINDKDRGKVWEETLVLLPREINLVLLSATIDKPEKMASWIGEIKKKNISLITTKHRVVPLKHYFWNEEDEKLDVIVNEHGKFINYNEIKKGYIKYNFTTIINNFVNYLKTRNLLPAIYFKFSRKKCESCAKKIISTLVTFDEKREIELIFKTQMAPFKKYYENMQQYHDVYNQLLTGVVYHHSGLIPILKEIIEILYAKGLIKLLFATETFAVGVNMPAKTVIFNDLEKYDNNGLRNLRTDEYLQMSGRAGRRGLDKNGTVIILPTCNLPSHSILKSIMTGKSPGINSKFIPSYQFVLKALHNKDLKVEKFVETTLYSDENLVKICRMKKELNELINNFNTSDYKKEYDNMSKEIIELFDDYYKMIKRMNDTFLKLPNKKLNQFKKKVKKIEKIDIFNENKKIMDKVDDYYNKKKELDKNIYTLQNHLHIDIENIMNILYDNYFIDDDYKLCEKGLIAIEINDCNPIVFTELLYNNMFNKLTIEEIVAVLACNIEMKMNNHIVNSISLLNLTENSKNVLYQIQDINNDFQYFEDVKYNVRTDANYKIYLEFIEPVFMWIRGCSIKDILQKFDMYEGNFVRGILRLNSICEDIIKICENNKNYDLMKKFEGIEEKLIRDVTTINSLYITK